MNAPNLRILMITGRADPGGGPEHLYQLSKQIGGTCEVFIASPKEDPFWGRYVQLVGQAKVFEIPHRRFSRATLKRLVAWCHLNRIDVVHSHGRAAGAYSRLFSRTKDWAGVHTAHGSLQLKSFKDYIYWFAEVLLARRTDHFIAVSNSEAQQLRRRLFLGKQLTVVPNGVVVPSTAVDATVCNAPPLRIIHITRFVPQKNSMMVLDILASLRQMGALDRFHVDVLGDGPGRSRMESEAQSRGLAGHMTFHGAQSSVAPFLARGYCMLTTSRWEGMPLAVLEALACGLPVIASDTPGNNDIVGPSVGRLFGIGKPQDAAAQLLELASNPETWSQLSRSAANLIKTEFSVERMGDQTVALYRQLVARSKSISTEVS